MKRTFRIVDLSGRSDYPVEAIKNLEGLKVKITPGDFYTSEEVIEGCKKADVLLVTATSITRDILDKLPSLKAVIRYGVGLDRIDLSAAKEKGVIVCNVTGFCAEEISEHALAIILNFNRNINGTQKNVRLGRWGYIEYLLHRLSQKQLGIVGFGEIGRLLARKASALGLSILAYDPYIKEVNVAGVKMVIFEEILKNSDYLSLHCPLNEETRYLIGEKELEMMKPNAVIINTARGGIIKESALITALQNKIIAGAGLDVLENEPPSDDNPLLTMDNVIITSHIAWYSEEASMELVTAVFKKLAHILRQLAEEDQ